MFQYNIEASISIIISIIVLKFMIVIYSFILSKKKYVLFWSNTLNCYNVSSSHSVRITKYGILNQIYMYEPISSYRWPWEGVAQHLFTFLP